jgi:hypothetical protein
MQAGHSWLQAGDSETSRKRGRSRREDRDGITDFCPIIVNPQVVRIICERLLNCINSSGNVSFSDQRNFDCHFKSVPCIRSEDIVMDIKFGETRSNLTIPEEYARNIYSTHEIRYTDKPQDAVCVGQIYYSYFR